MNLNSVAAALHALADAILEGGEAAAETPAPKRTRAPKAATESAQPAQTPAATSATAPAALPPAQPAAPTPPPPVKYTAKRGPKAGTVGTGIEAVNFAVLDLAGKKAGEDGVAGRDKALAVLGTFKVSRTPELKAEQYQAVIDAVEEEIAKMDAAATQVSLV
jgi:hypothetical protein